MSFNKYNERGAFHFDWYYKDQLDWYVKCVDRVVEFCKGSTLDLGCGEGVVAELIAKKGYDIVGVDSEREALAYADPDLDLRHGDIETDIFAPDQWEYLACLNVIEHLDHPEAVANIFRQAITKAGIIITDYPQEHPSSHHVREYTPEELANLFKEWRVVPFKINDDFHGVKVYK